MTTYAQIIEVLAAGVHESWMSAHRARGHVVVESRHGTGNLMVPYAELSLVDQDDDRRVVAAVLLGLARRPVAELLGLLHGLRGDDVLLAELRRAAIMCDPPPPGLVDGCAEAAAREDGQR